MVRVARWLVAVTLVSSPAFSQQVIVPGGLGSTAPAPPRDNSAKTGTARIRGHVFAADNGTPLRKAMVRAFSPELRESRVAITDAQGVYELKDLPAGRYTLVANKGSYVSLQYGQLRPLEPGKPLEILDAQLVDKVDFSLPRGCIVTGRVVDEFGDPIADVQVMPMRYQFTQGRRRLVPSGRSGMTNDIGEYRIYGLPPGQYYLSATLRNFMMMGGDSDDHSGYAPTYFPGTSNVAEAQRIKLDLGQMMTDVNMSLVATHTAKVSGTAFDAQGRPLSAGMVMAMQRGGATVMMFGPSANGQIKPDGTFSVSGLAPGEYTLRAMNGMPGPDGPEFAVADVTVGGEDVGGIQLMPMRRVTVTGRVILSDASAAQSLRPSTIRVGLRPVNPEDQMMMMGPNGGQVKDDLTFEIKAPPGRLIVSAGMMTPGWTMKAVRYNGLDVTDTGIDFGGSEVSGIEIELTNRVQEVSGLVTNTRGEPVKDYTVVVFSQDRDDWGKVTRHQGSGRPDQDGRFKIRNLPPGRYYAVALDYIEQGESGDPDFLDKEERNATPFTLGEGETKTLDLKLQTAS